MAQKRMFSLQVIDTDKFMDMPPSTRALYFHLGMHGDDDGFVSSPKKIMRAAGCNEDDLRLLALKEYIIPFESGVIVITDWNINNTLRNDRYHETTYTAEKASLCVTSTGKYILGNQVETIGIPNGSKLEPEHNITEHNITEHSIESVPLSADTPAQDAPKRKRFVPPTLEEVAEYVKSRNSPVDPQGFIDFYASKGWYVGNSHMKDWKAACRNAESWERWSKQKKERNTVKTAADYDGGDSFI